MPLRDLVALLAEGGDERLDIDPATGLNMYGCAPSPRPAEIGFSSSTASTIGAEAFACLEADWTRIAADCERHGEARTYRRELDRIRADFRDGMGLDTTDMILAASGTDIHLLAALLFAGLDGRRLVTLTLPGSETGSAVPMASAGNNFMTRPPGGASVEKGSALAVGDDIRNLTFAARHADGRLRDDADIATELAAHITQARNQGDRCLLVVADISKTGLITPGLDTVFRLRAEFPDCLDILIDACQLRLAPATLRAYLAQNFLVAVTGSKFLAGPVFSGALLVPPKQAVRLRHRPMPVELGNYCSRWDWPDGWIAQATLPDRANFGLVLRWRAALHGLTTLTAVSPDTVCHAVSALAQAVSRRIDSDPAFAAIDTRPLDRSILLGDAALPGFDALLTVFPFCLRHPGGDLLTPAETLDVYRGLAAGSSDYPGLRLGQPVAVGAGSSALRLCLSAPMLAAACGSHAALIDLIDTAARALDRVAQFSAAMGRDRNSRVA